MEDFRMSERYDLGSQVAQQAAAKAAAEQAARERAAEQARTQPARYLGDMALATY